MPKASFIYELPLQTTPYDEGVLDRRFDSGGALFNACLGEGLRRLDLMKERKIWHRARKCADKKERKELFKRIQKEACLSDYNLQAFAIKTKNSCHISDHLDTHSVQKIATRAFNAVSEYMFGKRGRPRFKNRKRFRSIEGKSNASGIRFKDGKIYWSGLELKPIYDLKDKHGVEAHALSCRTKYVRLVKKEINRKSRYYAQLVQEGVPLIKEKNSAGRDVVGIDIGPSTIAVFATRAAFLTAFCSSLKLIQEPIKYIQKFIERSRRAMNKSNFNADGTIKSGAKKWQQSRRYRKAKAQVGELHRRMGETRKRLHGELCNKIIGMGSTIHAEKLSYKSFQKQWGKSVGARAPGMFIDKLRDKAERAGGSLIEFSTRSTKLSQTCHGCEPLIKKKLSERMHQCPCGIGPVQRDLYTAYLAKFVTNDSLNKSQAQEAWPDAEPLLRRALLSLNETASGKSRLASFGLSQVQRQSGSHVEDGSMPSEATDVVWTGQPGPESCGELGSIAVRTPGL
jgi:putative transposase